MRPRLRDAVSTAATAAVNRMPPRLAQPIEPEARLGVLLGLASDDEATSVGKRHWLLE